MFSFEWPWMILLLPLPLLARWILPRRRAGDRMRAPEITFPHLDRLRAAFPHAEGGKRRAGAHYVILSLVWICLTAALMRPQLVDSFTQAKTEGRDIMLAVDLSGSMRAMDYVVGHKRVSRLGIVKSVVSRFVADRKGDRIGLILFGTHAYLHVPLTFDTGSVRRMLDNTIVGEAGDATAIGDAIGLAVRNLRDRPENSRVLILLTDGNDTASSVPPLEAAKLAKAYGIRVYTIGIGMSDAVPTPMADGRVQMVEFDRDDSLLRDIAKETGGRYFLATDTKALRKVYDEIDKLEKTKGVSRTYMIRHPLYRYPLGAALALLFLFSLVPVYRGVSHVA